MTGTLAYEIGAAFFLAVLIMGGSMMRGLFPAELFKNIKLAAILGIAGLAGMGAYQSLPANWSEVFSRGTGPASGVPEQPAANHVAPAKLATAPGRIRDTPYVITVKPEQLHDAPAADQPQPEVPVIVRPNEDSDRPDSRSKRVVKSVGRLLRLGHKKDNEDR
ncbi:MAG TPA: hypothetical protein VGN17_17045 [Bryobacteraceae bacterium]|jgi:hypothetical protein